MIHMLRLKNFYSFRDPVELNLMASGPAPEFPDHLVPLYDGSSIYGPQVVGLFGPNAAGK